MTGLCAGVVHVITHHTKPGRLHQNLSFVSSVSTCGIPFQTIGHDIDILL